VKAPASFFLRLIKATIFYKWNFLKVQVVEKRLAHRGITCYFINRDTN
jgi:hypothetical protein